jgi:hypothetical protein
MAARLFSLRFTLVKPLMATDTVAVTHHSAAQAIAGLAPGDRVYLEAWRGGAKELLALVVPSGALIPDPHGHVKLPVERGVFGTPALTWPTGLCLSEACCDERVLAKVFETAPWLSPAISAWAMAHPVELTTALRAYTEQVLPTMVALQVSQVTPDAVTSMVTTALAQRLDGAVELAVAARLEAMVSNTLAGRVAAYLDDHLASLVGPLVRAHPCCAGCPPPTVVHALCPGVATVNVPYEGLIVLSNVTRVAQVTGLPAWASYTFDATAQVIRVMGVPDTTTTLAPSVQLENDC